MSHYSRRSYDKRYLLLALLFAAIRPEAQAFVGGGTSLSTQRARQQCHRFDLTRRYNFWKGIFDKAFENDPSLLNNADKVTGQLDASTDDDNRRQPRSSASLTPTQAKWQALQQAPPDIAETTVVAMDLYLCGVPERDPSSDLYASRTNISSRDRAVGLPLPAEPTVAGLRVELRPDGACVCRTETPFTPEVSGTGDWRWLPDTMADGDGAPARALRFRIPVAGYSRTVETRGTIRNVYWSKRNDGDPEVRRTSATYSIPAGWLYGDVRVSRNARRKLVLSTGVLKVEQTAGLLGAVTKLVPCGKFEATVVEAGAV